MIDFVLLIWFKGYLSKFELLRIFRRYLRISRPRPDYRAFTSFQTFDAATARVRLAAVRVTGAQSGAAQPPRWRVIPPYRLRPS